MKNSVLVLLIAISGSKGVDAIGGFVIPVAALVLSRPGSATPICVISAGLRITLGLRMIKSPRCVVIPPYGEARG